VLLHGEVILQNSATGKPSNVAPPSFLPMEAMYFSIHATDNLPVSFGCRNKSISMQKGKNETHASYSALNAG
jgi:hypothetical protein